MNILYIAYSCSPCSGSEDKIGWNVAWESTTYNNVYVITKEEHRDTITKFLRDNPNSKLHFYYVDIPLYYKKVLKSFLYSGRLNIWHRYVLPLAKKICVNEKIDIIHQITPVEFRAIGNYGEIVDTKFVVGPLGGGEYMPRSLQVYAKRHRGVEKVRKLLNGFYKKYYGIKKRFGSCDYIMFANEETKQYIGEKNLGKIKAYDVVTEIGVSKTEVCDDREVAYKEKGKCVLLAAGRLVYRKGYKLLLEALELLPSDMDYECRIVGSGPELQKLKKYVLNNNVLKNRITFCGNIPYSQMSEEYGKADVFVMPSLRETTGTVLLEAMSNGLPIITINKYGGAMLVNENNGWLYNGDSRTGYLNDLARCIEECIKMPEEVCRRGKNALETVYTYTWERKCKNYQVLYDKLINSK